MSPRVTQLVARFTAPRLFAAALAVSGVGCERMIVLGTDCPSRPGACDETNHQLDGDDLKDGDASGSAPDARGTASDEEDAAVDTPLPPQDAGRQLSVGNASFEANSDLLSSLAQPLTEPIGFSSIGVDVFIGNGLGSVPVVGDLLFSRVRPWYSCAPGTMALKSATVGATNYVAPEGEWFMRAPSYGGLYQNVSGGLVAGQSYSFQVTAAAHGDDGANVALRLGGTNAPCTANLGSTAAVSELLDRNWKTLCLTITPTETLKTLYIVPQVAGGNGTATLAFDDIQSVERCY